jgi:cytochrome P450
VEFNPFSYEFHEHPNATYAWLRDEEPAYHNPAIDFWALSRFEDVLGALHDYETFTSTKGVTIEQTGTTLEETEQGGGYGIRSLIDVDPPDHTALRKVAARRFTPRRIAELESQVRATTQSLLDHLGSRRAFDVVGDFSALLPTTVVATMLGFPMDQHEDLRRWTEEILHREPEDPHMPPAGVAAIGTMMAASAEVVAERRKEPTDDLLSMLVHSSVDGRPPTDAEMLGYCLVLITGGHETTSKLIANGVRLLAQHESQKRAVLRDPTLIRGAVEELLRYTSPTQYMARTTTRDVPMYDRTIPAGSKVALLLAAGNRDPREFDRPDEFDIGRPNARILAFGHGPHVCLGAAVARLESRVALEEFLRRYPEYDVDEDGVELLHSGNVHGPTTVPVRIS